MELVIVRILSEVLMAYLLIRCIFNTHTLDILYKMANRNGVANKIKRGIVSIYYIISTITINVFVPDAYKIHAMILRIVIMLIALLVLYIEVCLTVLNKDKEN